MQRILVFCGSSPGRRPEYAQAAQRLGRRLAERGLGLVYGGATVGLMGIAADAALAAGGEAIGVITQQLVDLEIPHAGLTEQRIVATMHERKAQMAQLADAVIALPGGIGTLDELFEMYTWRQLGLHAKPVALLDVAGYWQGLLGVLDQMVAERFLSAEQRAALLVDSDVDALLDRLAARPALEASVTDKWLDRGR